jgi:hypothetical protein
MTKKSIDEGSVKEKEENLLQAGAKQGSQKQLPDLRTFAHRSSYLITFPVTRTQRQQE